MAYGAAHRRVSSRLLVVAASVAVLAALVPASAASAAGHRDPPIVTVEGPDLGLTEAGASELDAATFGFGEGGDRLHAFSSDSNAVASVRPFFLDACDSAGQTWLFGTNGTGEALGITLVDPNTGRSASFEAPAGELPGADPGADPGAFFFLDSPSCDELHPSGPGRLPNLPGTLKYDGVGRQCASFDAGFAVGQSKPGRGYDTITFRGNQENRFIFDQPVVALDQSNLFDELTVLHAPPTGDSLDARADDIVGVVLGGRQGMLPKARKLRRVLEAIDPEERASILEDAIERVADNKPPRDLIRLLGADKKICAYHTQAAFKDGSDPDALGEMLELFEPPSPAFTDDERFTVVVEQADGASNEVPGVAITADAVAGLGSDSGSGWYFDSDAAGLLIKIFDGCELNGHHWVFAAASTDVAFTLNVTDTQSGASRSYANPLGQPLEPILDTAAFATCP